MNKISGMGKRAIASFVDIIVPAMLVATAMTILKVSPDMKGGRLLILVIFCLSYFSVAILGQLILGTTLGKRMMGLRIVNVKDFTSVTFIRFLIRLFSEILSFLLGWVTKATAFFRSDRRTLNDLMAGTIVIDLSKSPAADLKPRPILGCFFHLIAILTMYLYISDVEVPKKSTEQSSGITNYELIPFDGIELSDYQKQVFEACMARKASNSSRGCQCFAVNEEHVNKLYKDGLSNRRPTPFEEDQVTEVLFSVMHKCLCLDGVKDPNGVPCR